MADLLKDVPHGGACGVPSGPVEAAAALDEGKRVQEAIRVENVSKVYRLWNSPTARLRYSVLSQAHRALRSALPTDTPLLRALDARRRREGAEFHALRGVSFTVGRGESVGIIGRNGSGKSTLLQIIAGTLTPTAGSVEVQGRVAALLELGSGFNIEFTGRENVFLNAAILGLSRAETEERFDRIAAFADIGPFLDQPVKTYSSGMVVRLAFAVQTAVDPDVLIVDEALAVGDIYFQSKCFRLLRARQDAGMTLLFVSHDTASVRSLCQRSLTLHDGAAVFFGASDRAVNVYTSIMEGRVAGEATTAGEDAGPPPATAPGSWEVPAALGRREDEIGSREVEITGAAIFTHDGHPAASFRSGETICAAFRMRARQTVDDLLAGFCVRDRKGNVVTAGTTLNQGWPAETIAADEERVWSLSLPGRFAPGEYLLDLGLGGAPGADGRHDLHYHRVGGVATFQVIAETGSIPRFQGMVDVGAEFRHLNAEPQV